MGSHGPDPNALQANNAKDEADVDEDLTILVTGFGPFKTHTTNPSFLIATSLPHSLTFILPPSPSSTSSQTPITNASPSPHTHTKTRVNIIPHPTPLPVSYASSSTLVPTLLRNTYSGVDFILHIGMASGRGYYTVERWGRRDGYVLPDVDGEVPGGGTADGGLRSEGTKGEGGGEEGETRAERGPEILGSTVLGEDVLRQWIEGCQDIDVRISDDAGRYLCDFTYYTSLLEFWRRDREGERPVVFLHVPGEFAEEDLATGREVVLALIGALVEGRVREGKGKGEGDRGGEGRRAMKH